MLIGVTGYAQAGKSTVGRYLESRHGFKQVAFADKLRELALIINPLIDYGGESPEDYTVERLADAVARSGWETAKTNGEVRRFLQVLGTEGVRGVLGEDTWVLALDDKVREMLTTWARIVVTDVRFPNEEAWLHTYDQGVLIRVDRPGVVAAPREHESEVWVPKLSADYVLTNDGTLADLYEKVDGVLHVEEAVWEYD